jgi:hypothetical protein
VSGETVVADSRGVVYVEPGTGAVHEAELACWNCRIGRRFSPTMWGANPFRLFQVATTL